MEHEQHYLQLRIRIVEAIRLTQEANDQFLEWMLGLSLAETEEKLKKFASAKPVKTRRALSESRPTTL